MPGSRIFDEWQHAFPMPPCRPLPIFACWPSSAACDFRLVRRCWNATEFLLQATGCDGRRPRGPPFRTWPYFLSSLSFCAVALNFALPSTPAILPAHQLSQALSRMFASDSREEAPGLLDALLAGSGVLAAQSSNPEGNRR